MTSTQRFLSSPVIWRATLNTTAIAALLSLTSGAVFAQASGPAPNGPPPIPEMPLPTDTPQSTGARNAVTRALDDGKSSTIKNAIGSRAVPGVRAGLVTQVGNGQPVGEGSRVLTIPGKCTPKTNSLDCITDSGQNSGGANVSGRVRNSVIGEVGAGKAATEGAGKAKGEKTCTPAPGKLTCE